MKVTISIKSEQLNVEDLHALLQAIRTCEVSTFPQKLIGISVIAPDMSSRAMEMLLKSIDPPYEIGPVVIPFNSEEKP